MHLFDLIRRNPASTITTLLAAVAAFIPFIGKLQEDTAPLGVSPAFWVIVSAVAASVVILGQMWQRAQSYTVGVSWKAPSSWGYLLGGVGLLTPFIADLQGTLDPVGVPQSVWFAVGSFITVATTIGRYWQAVFPARNGGFVIPEPVPSEGGAGEPQ